MRKHSINNLLADRPMQLMTLDILQNVLHLANKPSELGEYLVNQMRELTGARLAILFQLAASCPHDPKVVNFSPKRRRDDVRKTEMALLASKTACLDESVVWLHYIEHRETKALLDRLGCDSGYGVPLRIGTDRTGALLLLDIPSTYRTASVIETLNVLAPVVAALMRHSALFENLEIEILKRTKELSESEERFRGAFDNSLVGMTLMGTDGRFFLTNPALQKIFGYSKEELTEMTYHQLTLPEDMEVGEEFMRRVIAGEADSDIFEKRYIRKNGEVFSALVSSRIIRDNKGQPCHFVAQIMDISDRKRAEEERLNLEKQIQHAQKLESLGVLAGGIAHDFNNLLMGILGNANLALHQMSPETIGRQYIQKIETAANQAAELTNQLLAYSGKGRFVVEPVNLNHLIREIVPLFNTIISKKATLQYNIADDLPAIEADASQIRQIIMNLITNASDALEDHIGNISIETGVVEVDRIYLSNFFLGENLGEGKYVFLAVSDTGSGMDNETLAKIFDPFFTTKFTGRGLGLAAVLGIVKGHKAAIRIYSEQGQGSNFKIIFPCSEASVREKREIKLESAKVSVNEATVLVADDDEAVLEIAKNMLQALGFKVLTAEDGRKAVEVFKENSNKIDLVLLDMTMPRLSGKEAFYELRCLKPNLKVILSSGYNEQDATSRFEGNGLAGFIQKPYNMRKLVEKIQEILKS